MRKTTIILFVLIIPMVLSAQLDSIRSKLSFIADFRFRIEQDWNSRKPDGTFRNDRTRFRYRLRAGMNYTDNWYRTGFQLRTGNPRKQQDPQLTLGEGFKEFGTLPIGFEKAYFQGKWKQFTFWVGKNTYPFEKSNELFWSDNVFPEGIFLQKGFHFDSKFIDEIQLRAGHFIISASGRSLDMDAYFQGYQSQLSLFKKRFELFPSLYLFKNVPNIPDGNETFEIDYSIFHIGSRYKVLKKLPLYVEFDYYHNIQDYNSKDSIPSDLKDQKSGWVTALKYGVQEQKGDWLFTATYAYLQRYAAVDIMAQNDWARWSYSSFGSPDGRLTNLNGLELVAAYMIDQNLSLTMKYYLVEQLIPYGLAKETGSRIRLDLDVIF